MSKQKVLEFNSSDMFNAEYDVDARLFTFEVNGVKHEIYIAEQGEPDRIEEFVFSDGSSVALADLARALNLPDLETAAGPSAGAPGSGLGAYNDDPGALIDGLDRLGTLGTFHWGRETEVPEEMHGFYRSGDNRPNWSIDITPINPGDNGGTPEKPAIQYNMNASGLDVTVDEAYIVNGTSNTSGTNPTYPIQFMISGNDTLATFTVNGVILNYVNGQLVFADGSSSINLANGTLTSPSLVQNGSNYILTFEFTQSHSETHTEQGIDRADSINIISISVTGVNGSTASSNAVINIIDDIPEITVVDLVDVLQYASTPTEIGTVEYQYGADHNGTLEIGINGQWLEVKTDTPYEYYSSSGAHLGTIILVDNGTGYSVQFLQDKLAKGQHNIDLDFRVIDGDGDVVHGDNNARTDTDDPGVPDISITINEVKIEADPDDNWVKEDVKEVATGNILINDKADLDFTLDTFDGKAFVDGKVVVDTPYGVLTVYENGDYEYQFRDTTPSLNRDFETDLQFDYTIKDEIGNIADSTLIINIQGTNDAPYISSIVTGYDLPDTGSVGYIKGQINFGDVDEGDIAKISVDGKEVNGSVTLELRDPANGNIIGELTINEDGSYYFQNKPGVIPPEGISFTIPVSVSDGELLNDASIEISLGINENASDAFKPKAGADSYTVYEDGGLDGHAKDELTIDYELGNVLVNDKNALGDVGADNLATVAQTIVGKYGTLYIDAEGNAKYVLNNANAAVNGLIDGEKLTESFTYELVDTTSGKSSFGNIAVDIAGRNDEAGSLNSGLLIRAENGYTRSGSLLKGAEITTWDNDKGSASYTGSKNLIVDPDQRTSDQYEWTVKNGTVVEEGFTYSADKINGVNLGNANYNIPVGAIEGQYGWLVLNGNTGKYTYILDYNKIADWTSADKANEVFTLKFVDKQTGAESEISLVFNITGGEDTPTVDEAKAVMTEDAAMCSGVVTATSIDNYKNDPNDHSDEVNNDYWYTTSENAGVSKAVAVAASTMIEGKYGYLILNGDGSYSYHKYHLIAELEELAPGQSIIEEFGVVVHTPNQNVQNTGTIIITIEGANDNPIATSEVIEGGWKGIFEVTGNLDAYDIDKGDNVHYTQGTDKQIVYGKYGYFEILDDGSYKYVCIDSNWNYGVDRGTYIVYDENGGSSEGKLIIINHGTDGGGTGPVVDIARDDVFTVKEDSYNVELDYKANDMVDNELLMAPGHYFGQYGVLTVHEDGRMTYQLDNRNPAIQALGEGEIFSDHETFIYKVINGTTVEEAEIKIFIEGVNDAPEFNPQTGMSITEAAPIFDNVLDKWIPGESSIEFKMNVIDIDTVLKDDTPVNNILVGAYGTLEIVFENGEWIGKYTLHQNDVVGDLNASSGNKTDTFEVTFYDGYDFVTQQIPITVKPFSDEAVNDSEIITEDRVTGVEIDYSANDTGKGAIGSTVTGLGVSGGTLGNVDNTPTEVLGKFGKLVYDPSTDKMIYQLYDDYHAGYNSVQGLHEGESLNDVFTYQLTDAFGYATTANVTIKINGVADGIDGKGYVEISATETTDRIEGFVEIADKDSLYKFNTDIDGAHDALVHGDISFISTLTMTMQYTDSHAENHIVNGAIDTEYGQIVFDPDTGKYTFLVDNDSVRHLGIGESVTESFIISSVDEAGNKFTQNLDIIINGENDLPVVENISCTVSNGVGSIEGVIEGKDADINDVLSYSLKDGLFSSDIDGNYSYTDMEYGTVKVYENGAWKFESNGNIIGNDDFKNFIIETSDGHESVESLLNLNFVSTSDADSLSLSSSNQAGLESLIQTSYADVQNAQSTPEEDMIKFLMETSII